MFLAIQIGLAIIIAYLVAESRHETFRPVRRLSLWVLVLWALAPFLWVLSAIIPGIHPSIMFILAAAIATTAVLGAFGLWSLLRKLWPRRVRRNASLIILAGIANIVIVQLFIRLVVAHTPLGTEYARIDLWSRLNGLEAGGSLTVQAAVWLWPYIPLLLMLRFRERHSSNVGSRTRHCR